MLKSAPATPRCLHCASRRRTHLRFCQVPSAGGAIWHSPGIRKRAVQASVVTLRAAPWHQGRTACHRQRCFSPVRCVPLRYLPTRSVSGPVLTCRVEPGSWEAIEHQLIARFDGILGRFRSPIKFLEDADKDVSGWSALNLNARIVAPSQLGSHFQCELVMLWQALTNTVLI